MRRWRAGVAADGGGDRGGAHDGVLQHGGGRGAAVEPAYAGVENGGAVFEAAGDDAAVVFATLAGITCALLGWKLPTAVDKTFASLGEMALPLGLLGVGRASISGEIGAALAGAADGGGDRDGGGAARWLGGRRRASGIGGWS